MTTFQEPWRINQPRIKEIYTELRRLKLFEPLLEMFMTELVAMSAAKSKS